jgi:hypothetical protein
LKFSGGWARRRASFYNAWNPVVHAQKESLELLKASLPELQKLVNESEKLTEQSRRRQFGSAFVLQGQAETSAHDAASDQLTIDLIRGKIRDAEARVSTGTIAATGPSTVVGKGGAEFTRPGAAGGLTVDARAAQEKLIGLNAQLENAIYQQKVDRLKSEEATAELSKENLNKERERQDKIESINRKTDEIKERSIALRDKAELGPLGALGTIEANRRAAERRYVTELSLLDDQVRINRLGGPDTVRVPGSVFGAQRTAILGAREQDRLSLARERDAAQFKQDEDLKISRERFNEFDLTRQSPGVEEIEKLTIKSIQDELKKASKGFRADEEIRRIGIGTQREGIQRQFSLAQTLSSNSTFNQYDAITQAANLRITLVLLR